MIELKFSSLRGQGIMTAVKTLPETVPIYKERYAIMVPTHGYERRGASVNISTITDSKSVLLNCFVYEPETALVSDDSFLTGETDVGVGISESLVLVLNTKTEDIAEQFKEKFGFQGVYYVDATHITQENAKRDISNSAMLGIPARTGIVKIKSVMAVVQSIFGTKASSTDADAAREAHDETRKIQG